jgi:type I restriction enzyme R subunit
VTKQETNERIAALIEQSIQSTGVINLFETKREFSLFDEGFIEELRKMKEKNLAVQLLEKLVKERIRQYERTNIVQSQKFSELMNQALSNYLKGMLTNEEVIEELLKMAAEIKKTEEEGNELGLNVEEKAFYDALTSPEGIRDAYSNDEFIALTKELTEQLRKNRTIDWNKKESARAKMRVLVKRLLKKYKYPPEGQEQALNTVMAQCNKWADEEENLMPNSSVPNEKTKTVGGKKAIEATFIPPGTILNDINSDNDVRRLIHNMMGLDEGTTIMQIVVECQKEFQEKYFNMKGNDWRHLVRDYVREVTEQPDLQENEVFRFSIAG